MTPDHEFRDYRGRHITVLGLGLFGGGVGAVRFLVERGAIVTVSDLRTAEQLAEPMTELRDTPPAEWRLGRQQESDIAGAELVVVNPAIRRDHPLLQAARTRGIPLTSEMNLFWQHQRGTIAGVTGSNGKSTTTALTHSILKQSGRKVWLGGNVGVSLLPVVEQIPPGDLVVLELSSFQLTDLDRLQVSPHVAVVTNFSANHLDWHANLDHYRWAKQTMLRWQTPSDVAVLNADDAEVRGWDVRGQRRLFGLEDDQARELSQWLKLPGLHNLANALAATTAARSLGATWEQVRRGLESYEPLPHRLQFVGEVNGRKFYNDSLATTPESAIVGVEAFREPVVLLCGGYDKQVDLSAMARIIGQRAKAIALMGQTAGKLQTLLAQEPLTRAKVSPPAPDFPAAFRWAWEQSVPGDVILLSPGCASYDWFCNFADRGEQFCQLVRDLS